MYGYALLPGKDAELFARMGLKPNDVAIEINGVRLNDMQQAYGVINELREASQASIKIERDGEIRDIQVNLSQ
jgi:general secretion pathway protein C